MSGQTEVSCWKQVEIHANYLFHICSDCLVYISQKKDSPLGHDEFSAIMAQRKIIGMQKHSCIFEHVIR